MRSFILIRDPIHGTEMVLVPGQLVLTETSYGLEPAEAETLNIGEVVRCKGCRWVVRHANSHGQEVAA